MFVRVETGLKADFSDPEAKAIHEKLSEIHPALAEKIRWVRKLKVYWIELNAPRDKVVQTISAAFRNSVTDWLFSGDLLPSAGGETGSLFDLMQASPFRPGIFHGIEKRKRLQHHDEAALVVLQALQTILGRKSNQDRVVTGELLLMEGLKLAQSDLEWVARNWFSHERFESWSLLSEEELKRNSRFQTEQVAKYLMTTQSMTRSRLLQFRPEAQAQAATTDWNKVTEFLRAPVSTNAEAEIHSQDDYEIRAEIRFASDNIHLDTQLETEFHLAKQQLENENIGLQTVLGVLPDKHRLWQGEYNDAHPLRVRDEFELALERIAETTGTPVVQMKVFEDSHEGSSSYFWSSALSMKEGQVRPRESSKGDIVDLIFVGHHESPAFNDLILVENFKAAIKRMNASEAVDFALPASGKTLLQVLKNPNSGLKYGFDLVLDGILPWFTKYLEAPLPLSQIWGVKEEKRSYVLEELEERGIPYLHFGSTALTGEIRILEQGELRTKVHATDFFKTNKVETALCAEPIYLEEEHVQPAKFKNRFSVEDLLLKPETYHVSISSPVVLRPNLSTWMGTMVLSDLCGQEFNPEYLEYLFRKCTAIGGQIQSVQVSLLNGLSSWQKTLNDAVQNFGIHLSQIETISKPEINAHWLAIQVISKIEDIRGIRSEDFKQVHDRIYWLQGNFGDPATRWLAGMEGRYQGSIHSAVAIESTQDRIGVIDTLTYALLKHKLGAEVKIQHHFAAGFFVSVNENERFVVEQEWRAMDINYEFVGRITSSPFLVIRDENEQSHTISIEDKV